MFIALFLSGFIIMFQEGFSQAVHKSGHLSSPMHSRALPPSMQDHGGETSATSLSSANSYSSYLGPEGSMYYDDQWMNGKVVLADESEMNDIKLRYNVYYKQMQFIHEEDTAAIAKPDELSYLVIGDEKFISSRYISNHQIGTDYFKVLVEGDCQLLQRILVKYHEVLDSGESSKERFIKCCELYIKKEGQPAQQIRCNRKSVCAVLDDGNGVIRQFMKDNGIRLKNHEELMEVVAYYNTLHQ
jgi:hypothetical protein